MGLAKMYYLCCEKRVYYEKYENYIKGHGESGRLFLHK